MDGPCQGCAALHQRLDFLEWLIMHPGCHPFSGEWFLAVHEYPVGDIYGQVRHRDGRQFTVACTRTPKPIPALTKAAGKEIAKRWPDKAA